VSYSTPEKLAARIGPRLYAQLTAETGNASDDVVAQGWLDAASMDIDIRIGNVYTVPVTAPLGQLLRLAGFEEQIALWFGWVYRGIGDQESAAAAAKVGYDKTMDFLDKIAAGTIDLPGVTPRLVITTGTAGVGWKSNTPVYTNENFRMF
jgi:phage gp36-like protein